MKKTTYTIGLSLLGVACLPAALTVLTPADINLGSTSTASFSDGNVTLTPLQGNTPATFNANAVRLGIDDFGTNANGFNDPDSVANNGNEEKLRFEFAPTIGLAGLAWDFSRASGNTADDGVIITGFVADPMATFSASSSSGLTATYDATAGSLRVNVVFFSSTLDSLILNPAASAGQTLLLAVQDTDEARAQLAIRSISYDVIPEPSSLALLGLGSLALVRRRR